MKNGPDHSWVLSSVQNGGSDNIYINFAMRYPFLWKPFQDLLRRSRVSIKRHNVLGVSRPLACQVWSKLKVGHVLNRFTVLSRVTVTSSTCGVLYEVGLGPSFFSRQYSPLYQTCHQLSADWSRMHLFSKLVEPMDISQVRLCGALNARTYRARSFPKANSSWVWLETDGGDTMSPSPSTAHRSSNTSLMASLERGNKLDLCIQSDAMTKF